MTSDEKDSPEADAGKAIAEWSERVTDAGPWGEAVEQMTEMERRVTAVVYNAAITLRMAREGQADERDLLWLEQLAYLKDDRQGPARTAIAAQIVAEHLEMYVRGDRDSAVRACIAALSSEFSGFASLSPTSVSELFARFVDTRQAGGHRTGNKLGAGGILVEMNTAADHPLGRSLSVANVRDAVKRSPPRRRNAP